jgi:hypothetical protein
VVLLATLAGPAALNHPWLIRAHKGFPLAAGRTADAAQVFAALNAVKVALQPAQNVGP